MILRLIFLRNWLKYLFLVILFCINVTAVSMQRIQIKDRTAIQQCLAPKLQAKIQTFLESYFEHDPINKNYVCAECRMIHDSDRECYAHYIEKHEKKCLICNTTFTKLDRLRYHLSSEKVTDDHKELYKIFFIKECMCGFRSLTEQGIKVHKAWKCEKSEKPKKRMRSEKVHETEVKKLKPLICNETLD